MDDRRKEKRVSIAFPVKCTILPERKRTFCTVTKDLSSAGIRILHEDFLPAGKTLKVNINLLTEILAAKAQVVWCNRMSHSEGYYVGLRFLEIN